MKTFNDFRNEAILLWRDRDIAAHEPNLPFKRLPGERLMCFDDNLYAAVRGDTFRTVIDGKEYTAGSRTNIAWPLYALTHVHVSEPSLGELVRNASVMLAARPAFSYCAEALGREDVDEHLLTLTIRTNEPFWCDWKTSERQSALSVWATTQLHIWLKTPKQEV
jgi:hypothetical protein